MSGLPACVYLGIWRLIVRYRYIVQHKKSRIAISIRINNYLFPVILMLWSKVMSVIGEWLSLIVIIPECVHTTFVLCTRMMCVAQFHQFHCQRVEQSMLFELHLIEDAVAGMSCLQANEKNQTALPATHATSSPTPARQTDRRGVPEKAAATVEKEALAAAAVKRETRDKHVVALARQVSLERSVRSQIRCSFCNRCTVVTGQE